MGFLVHLLLMGTVVNVHECMSTLLCIDTGHLGCECNFRLMNLFLSVNP